MGATVGAACVATVSWCSAGRSPESRRRAELAGLEEVDSLEELTGASRVIVSVCPPGEALAVARSVAELGFDGVYVDANAIAPSTAREVGALFDRFVDGGIVGPPASQSGTTRMYVSGDEAPAIADLWTGSALDVRVIDGGAGAASALKMAYATWTKVSGALLLDVRALAVAEGVEEALLAEWAISQPGTTERSLSTARGVAPKAWRFVGEMDQIARSFSDVGLPDGFAIGAAQVYERLASFKDVASSDVEPADVIARLVADDQA
jgi:3-hydroxyisobutyrate dehydrogenase-like beta-hydroxyacid dehydrogenase